MRPWPCVLPFSAFNFCVVAHTDRTLKSMDKKNTLGRRRQHVSMTSNHAECLSTSLGIPLSVDGLSCGASLAPSDADTDTVLIAHSDSSPAFVHRLRNAVSP